MDRPITACNRLNSNLDNKCILFFASTSFVSAFFFTDEAVKRYCTLVCGMLFEEKAW